MDRKITLFFIGLFVSYNSSYAFFESKTASEWGNGYCYNFVIKNDTNAVINNWNISFRLQNGININNKWSGDFLRNGENYTVNPLEWNKVLQIGQSTDIGFCVDNSNEKPTNILFNELSTPTSTPTSTSTPTPTPISNVITTEYPTEKWVAKGIDLNGDGKNDRIMIVTPWNIASANGYAKMTYDTVNKKYYYEHDFTNISQINSSGWVHGYPEISVGKRPWGGQSTEGWTSLPKKISEINNMIFTTKYSIQNLSVGPLNVAREGWITSDANRSTTVSGNEIEYMLLLFHENIGPAGNKIGDVLNVPVKVNGVSITENFEVWKARFDWDFFIFIPSKNYNGEEFEIDLAYFLPTIKQNINYDIDNYYFMSWEMGSEFGNPSINYSKVKLEINKFELDVNGVISPISTSIPTSNPEQEFNIDSIYEILGDSQEEQKMSLVKINFTNSSFNTFQDKFDNLIIQKTTNFSILKYNEVVLLRNSILESLKYYENKKINKTTLINKLVVYTNKLKNLLQNYGN